MSRAPLGPVRSVAVIGAGIVGISVARHLQRDGCRVTVVDPLPPGQGASFGNAGGIAVTEVVPLSVPGLVWRVPRWVLDPLGPLHLSWPHLPRLVPWLWRFWRAGSRRQVEATSRALASLHATVYDDYDTLLAEASIRDILHRNGCISLYESEAALRRDALEWEIKRTCDIRLEAGMFMPDWGHVTDPHRVVTAIAEVFIRDGGTIRPGRAVDFEIAPEGPRALLTDGGERVAFDQLVVAAGAWSGGLSRRLGSRVPLESERGYHATLPRAGVRLRRMLHSAAGGFVLTPMAMGLRLAGTVELGGLRAPPDYRRAQVLVERATRLLPGLNAEGASVWMGHRPSLPDSLPVIGRSPHFANLFYAFGHGHLGLTEGPTTGRLVAALAAGRPPGIDLAPFRVDRF